MAPSNPTVPTTARNHPQTTSPLPTVAMSAVAATLRYVSRNRKRLRTPAWSAIAPRGGDERATMAIEVVTDNAHQKSPSPRSLPTTERA